MASTRPALVSDLAVLVALAITAALLAVPALCAASERLGKAYAAVLVPTTATAAPVAAPVASAAVTTTTAAPEALEAAPAALEALTVRQLRQMARQAGHRALARSGRKADLLVALAA